MQARKWYKMRLAFGDAVLVSPVEPAGMVRAFCGGAGLSAPREMWRCISADGQYYDANDFDLERGGIGAIDGPLDGMPDLSDEELEALLAKAQQQRHKEAQDAAKAAAADAARRAALVDEYPYLVPLAKTPGKSQHAAGAANLRRELERAFAGVKFRVTSKSYSGGCSISVGWEYGPTTKQVDEFCGKYRTRDFDGMTDCESVRRNLHADVFGGAGYVFSNREIPHDTSVAVPDGWFSTGLFGLVARNLCLLQGVEFSGSPYQRGLCGAGDTFDLRDHCNHVISGTSFPAGFTLDQFDGVRRVEAGGAWQPWEIVIK